MKICADTKSLCMQFESVVTNSSLTFADIQFLDCLLYTSPIPTDEDVSSLSAIIMDDDYYHFTKSDGDRIRCDQKEQEINAYAELVKKNIDFDVLLHTYSREQDLVEEIYQLILETVQTEKNMIRIAGEYYPAGFVKGKLLKLNYSHIEYVLECMDKNTTKVRNIKQYLLAALFNAPSTIGSYYKAAVNHDMPQYAN